ncbi:hypothetical protein LJC64_05310 [Ruminococcaceae bacterium OttesenSCG-928-A11]|nr:hypothetical protein [Ruminococcaceae bacterium OttesenSCG-928-A11]
MYYDKETGVKSYLGLFSRLTVWALALLVVSAGVYLGIDYFAPEILVMREDDKTALNDKIKTEAVSDEYNFLRIPSIGLERQVVDKNTEGKIQITTSGNYITLSGRYRTLGITPSDTVNLSPLALTSKLKEGQMIYLDYNGERLAYEVQTMELKKAPNTSSGSDLVMYALNGDGSLAEVVIRAKKLGKVEIEV